MRNIEHVVAAMDPRELVHAVPLYVDTPVLPALIDALEGVDPDLAVPVLVPLLKHEDPDVRCQVLHVLETMIWQDAAWDAVERCSANPNEATHVRRIAEKILRD